MKLTICGSLRFESEVRFWHEELALSGHVVYGMVVLPSEKGGNKDWYTDEQKLRLDLIHLAKIEESDGVFVVDVDGYIGESTRREIMWAEIREKLVYYLSRDDGVWLTGKEGLLNGMKDSLDISNGGK